MSRRNYLQLRFSESELAAYQALADKVNIPLATWVRDTLNNAVQLDDVRVEFDRRYAKAEEKGREFARKLLSRNASKMYIKGRQMNFPNKINRERSSAEISCPIRGCFLGSNHLGPCVPKYADSETQEIVEQNLLILSRDDPEGFRNRIRELLRTKGDSE